MNLVVKLKRLIRPNNLVLVTILAVRTMRMIVVLQYEISLITIIMRFLRKKNLYLLKSLVVKKKIVVMIMLKNPVAKMLILPLKIAI